MELRPANPTDNESFFLAGRFGLDRTEKGLKNAKDEKC